MKKIVLLAIPLLAVAGGVMWVMDGQRAPWSGAGPATEVPAQVKGEDLGARRFTVPEQPGRSGTKAPDSVSPGMVVRRSDESRIRASILPDDERAHIRERLAELESDVAQQIKAYDENLSDLEVRAQIEQQFGAQSDEIKQLAMKLAKDELARGKLQSMN
jgi:hypothetical protein